MSSSRQKNAFITGLNGFVGRYLAQELRAAGYRVYGTARRSPAEEGVFPLDICDGHGLTEAIASVQPEVVAHLAGISFTVHADVAEMYRANVIGPRVLLQAIADSGASPRCVFLSSSCHVYGNLEADRIDENTATSPESDYAVGKLAMEHIARLWMGRLPIVIARPFNYTGVGQSEQFLLPKIVSHFASGAREIELGNIGVSRDFSDVRTVAACYRRLIEKAPAGETFNVCSGVAHSLGEVLTMLSGVAGYEIDVRVNPALIRKKDVSRMVGCNARLQQAIGTFDPIPLPATLQWMLAALAQGR